MIKFNDNNIIVGYIKQLLHTTYLPNFPVYKSNSECYEGGLYVKGNGIYQFLNGELKLITPYKFNMRIENYTKTLKLENDIYDWHTHEYLGEYLRFYKDYYNLNLMSLYNCFSGRMPENLKIEEKDDKDNIILRVTSQDENYSLYIVPVKFNSKYSIYIESPGCVEMMPILYDKGYYKTDDSFNNLTFKGHKKFSNSSFMKPIQYDFLKPDNEFEFYEFLKYENDLKLLIKVPFNTNSSIVVLEDNQISNQGFSIGIDCYDVKANKSVVNFEAPDLTKVPMKSRSQLLQINSHISHPFADRLLEYLTDNSITHLDTISDNIARVQHELIRRIGDNKTGLSTVKYEGIWEDKYKGILYEVAKEEGLLDNNFDILGYVDKDVELKLGEDYNLYEDLWYEESK